jgi:hypothetical protein
LSEHHHIKHPPHLHAHHWQSIASVLAHHSTSFSPTLAQSFRKLVITRLLSENILMLLLQYIGLMFSTLTPSPMPLWTASGTACAFIFLRGMRILPGIGLGTLIAFYLASGSLSLGLGAALIFMLQPAALLWLSYRYTGPSLVFYDNPSWIKFTFFSAIVTGVVSLSLLRMASLPFSLALSTWLANFNGLLIFAFALTALDAYFPQCHTLKQVNKPILITFYGLLLLLSLTLLFSQHALSIIMISLASLALIIMISLRFAWCGTIAALFLFGLALSLGAYLETPLFSTTNNIMTLVFLQVIISAAIFMGWLSYRAR